jgi:hypothetical protein
VTARARRRTFGIKRKRSQPRLICSCNSPGYKAGGDASGARWREPGDGYLEIDFPVVGLGVPNRAAGRPKVWRCGQHEPLIRRDLTEPAMRGSNQMKCVAGPQGTSRRKFTSRRLNPVQERSITGIAVITPLPASSRKRSGRIAASAGVAGPSRICDGPSTPSRLCRSPTSMAFPTPRKFTGRFPSGSFQ